MSLVVEGHCQGGGQLDGGGVVMLNWLAELIVNCPYFLAQVIVLLALADVGSYVMMLVVVHIVGSELDNLRDKLNGLENELLE